MLQHSTSFKKKSDIPYFSASTPSLLAPLIVFSAFSLTNVPISSHVCLYLAAPEKQVTNGQEQYTLQQEDNQVPKPVLCSAFKVFSFLQAISRISTLQ